MTAKSNELVNELVSACIAFGRQVEPDWQTRIDKAQRELREYIAELEADNAEFRQLIRDWSIVLEQNDEFQLWQVESVRQAMLEINKEREE